MGKPVGYFSLDHENSLIHDMTEQWGEDLSQMSQADALWLIGRIASEAWMEIDNDEPPSDEADAVRNRLAELKFWEKVALIKALLQ